MEQIKGTFEVGFISSVGFSGTFKVAAKFNVDEKKFQHQINSILNDMESFAQVQNRTPNSVNSYGREILEMWANFRPLDAETSQKEFYAQVLAYLRKLGWRIK